MVVIALDSTTAQHQAKFSVDSGIAFNPPTPTSPPLLHQQEGVIDLGDNDRPESEVEIGSEAGPSFQPRQIPPPGNPRRHRSGVMLMSRVRAPSGGSALSSTGMPGSKSWGDFSSIGLGMSSMVRKRSKDESAGDDGDSLGEGHGRRVLSEGARKEEEEGIWDNSARFYHHLHSRPPSRSASRSNSPTRTVDGDGWHKTQPTSPSSSGATPSASPIFVRRNLTLPPHPPPGAGMSASLSPNHHFLQQHLPPAFPYSSVPETLETSHSMVILTPTTQEWRELKSIGRLEGSMSSSGSSSDGDRRSSLGSDDGNILSASSSMLLHTLTHSRRPSFKSSLSAEFLGAETTHSPDPGSPDEKPTFNPVIIAPSPIVRADAQAPTPLDTPTRNGRDDNAYGFSIDDMDDSSDALHDDSPVRFASIGRRESLRAVPKKDDDGPKAKTKRELERERLFKMVDEQVEEADNLDDSRTGSWGVSGVQEIGSGGGLSLLTRPSSADPVMAGKSTPAFEGAIGKSPSLPLPIKSARLSPTQPMRPSPLQASPLSVDSGLPQLDRPSSPPQSTPSPPRRSPSPQKQYTRFDAIRSYARALSSHHHLDLEPSSPSSSPPKSPRSPRRRDTSRVSLVAGRIVQPFVYPPSTALPPGTNPNGSVLNQKPSLQSFSPFLSAQPPRTPNGSIQHPVFPRFDSTISFAPSTGAPSECGTPPAEATGGVGGRGIGDYSILSEAGKGAYGLVMRARVKGPKGEPVGDEVIIKYIIKARILADCWKKHKSLGPIPIEIHVMDQLRHLLYVPPKTLHPWDPARRRSQALPASPESLRASPVLGDEEVFTSAQKHLALEVRHAAERGHPNICKLLDFFEDKEFYYQPVVMPRFGTGVDLFDRVESQPTGLEPFEVRSLIGQLADAVRFLHSNGIVHRDIKDENVILDGNGKCQLIDFGSAAHWRPGKRWDTFSGTLHYASPEILRGEMYGGKEQDVWALGVVGYVLLVGETPFSVLPDEVLVGFNGDSRAEQALEERCDGLHKDEGEEEDGGGRLEDAADLIRRCLEFEPSDRPTAEVLINHRYLIGRQGWAGRKGWVKER
ncbi:hypothetical protein P7C73_g5553, partial [Tremellales sp. Uapishka_1]